MWNLRFLGRIRPLRLFVAFVFTKYFGRKWRIIKRGPLSGLLWKCHPGRQFWMPLGIYEKQTAEWLLSNLSAKSVFLDVGSNYGYFTLMAARIVGSLGRIYSLNLFQSMLL